MIEVLLSFLATIMNDIKPVFLLCLFFILKLFYSLNTYIALKTNSKPDLRKQAKIQRKKNFISIFVVIVCCLLEKLSPHFRFPLSIFVRPVLCCFFLGFQCCRRSPTKKKRKKTLFFAFFTCSFFLYIVFFLFLAQLFGGLLKALTY